MQLSAAFHSQLKSIREAHVFVFLILKAVINNQINGGPRLRKGLVIEMSMHFYRFYIMHLEDRALEFSTITHHASVTQCLGSVGGHDWYLGVAKPSIVDPNETKGTTGAEVESHCGHFYVSPSINDVQAFKISGSKFLKLNRGTWHAGPLFLDKSMDFYNLELSNTNVSIYYSCFCTVYIDYLKCICTCPCHVCNWLLKGSIVEKYKLK